MRLLKICLFSLIMLMLVINILITLPKIKASYAEYKQPYYEKLDNGYTLWKDVDKTLHVSGKSRNGTRVTYTVEMCDSFYYKPHTEQLKIANEINSSIKDYLKNNNIYIEDDTAKTAFGWKWIQSGKCYDPIGYNILTDYNDIMFVIATYKDWFNDDKKRMFTQKKKNSI